MTQPDTTPTAVNAYCPDGECAWTFQHPAHSPIWIPTCMICGRIDGVNIERQVGDLLGQHLADANTMIGSLGSQLAKTRAVVAEEIAQAIEAIDVGDPWTRNEAALTARDHAEPNDPAPAQTAPDAGGAA